MDIDLSTLREEWRQAVDGMEAVSAKWEAENRDPTQHEVHKFNRFQRKADEKREQYELAQADEERRRKRIQEARNLTLSRSDTGTPRWAMRTEGMSELRSRALFANEDATFLPDAGRAHMERMLRQDDDPNDRLAAYVVTLADRAYFRAFAKVLNDPVSGAQYWTPEERDAAQRVKVLERSMTLGTGSAGGFLVPYELDPSIVLTASYVDPLRQISRVETTVFNEKRFVTSAGSTSSWDPEETEVSDDSPVLAQPTVTAKKGATFVPVSIELYEDSDLAEQIGRVFADSKAAHESLSFTLTQTNGPIGLISAIVAAGGASVIATGTNVLAAADVYANASALPARWRQNASFMAHAAIINGYRQLPKATNIQESLVDDSGERPRMVGVPVYENSNMDGALTGAAADYVLISGDFQQYVIVDRIGASIELVPHLFGAAGRPKGQRGFYQHWRVGADVLVADAFRLTNYST
jgi:HK97 family phage major capsid protein